MPRAWRQALRRAGRRLHRPSRQVVAAGAAVAVVVALTVAAVWLLAPDGGDDDDGADAAGTLTAEERAEQRAATEWLEDVGALFQDLGRVVPTLVSRTDQWLAGELDGAELDESLRDWERVFAAAEREAADLDELDLAPGARELVELSAALYAEVATAHRAAVAIDDEDLAREVHLLARRVRVLADRVYDRGYALVEPFLHREDDPNVTVNLPEEVPVWASLDLAPGPPLAPRPRPYDGPDPLKEERRPEQDREDWIDALLLVNPPTGRQVEDAIEEEDARDLRALAERLVAAAEALREEPDPREGREEHTRVRLGLLVHADAARAGQAAVLADGRATGFLESVAERLVAVGNHPLFWVDELPPRSGEDAERGER